MSIEYLLCALFISIFELSRIKFNLKLKEIPKTLKFQLSFEQERLNASQMCAM